MKRTSRTLAIFATVIWLAGCGQKGPLYLPEEAPQNTPEAPSESSQVR
ncbi:hypothetical protein EYQ95_09455 [Lysobacter sp. N42]|nr:hypothetical protein DQX04_11010 [Aliidiomarina sp. B3213]TCZ90324.1 hypothetical protein EYQ95_09455 [Lysobacter sp. N42]